MITLYSEEGYTEPVFVNRYKLSEPLRKEHLQQAKTGDDFKRINQSLKKPSARALALIVSGTY